MIKTEEFVKGCWAKAYDDEMMFVLLARDPAAPVAIRAWQKERIRLGLDTSTSPKIAESEECAKTMQEQRATMKVRRDAEKHSGRNH